MQQSQPQPSWQTDTLLKRVLRNSGHLFSSTTISAALGVVQGILAARLLGDAGYGLVAGIVMVFATNVNRLLSFRMSEVTVKYVGEAFAQNNKPRAAALVKSIGLTEAATSILAYLVLLALTPWAAQTFAKDPATANLFRIYGLFLLANIVYETSSGVLQTFKRFDRLAAVNLIQSILTFILIAAAFLLHGTLVHVLLAYLAGKTLAGITIIWLAALELNRNLGPSWWQSRDQELKTDHWSLITGNSSSFIFHPSSFLPFALNTNLNGTVNLIVRDSPTLLLALFVTPAEVGIFKLALALINFITLPIEPFIWPTYAELTETIARSEWVATKRLLRRVSTISAAWTISAAVGLALFGGWLIPLVYGKDFAPAYPLTLILLIGFGFANILHWNRPLLLALGNPSFPLIASALVGAAQIALVFILVPSGGAIVMAWLMSAYFIFSISLIVYRGLTEIKHRANSPIP